MRRQNPNSREMTLYVVADTTVNRENSAAFVFGGGQKQGLVAPTRASQTPPDPFTVDFFICTLLTAAGVRGAFRL